jgi:hypothetical protein
MRSLLLFILLGLAALTLVTGTPSPAKAQFRRGGWHGGWRGGFYPTQLGALFQEAAEQAAKGQVDTKLLKEINHTVNRLRDLLTRDQTEQGRLPGAVYDEAERFLNRLGDAEAELRAGLKTPGAETR